MGRRRACVSGAVAVRSLTTARADGEAVLIDLATGARVSGFDSWT